MVILASKADKCTNGYSCGLACISRQKRCIREMADYISARISNFSNLIKPESKVNNSAETLIRSATKFFGNSITDSLADGQAHSNSYESLLGDFLEARKVDIDKLSIEELALLSSVYVSKKIEVFSNKEIQLGTTQDYILETFDLNKLKNPGQVNEFIRAYRAFSDLDTDTADKLRERVTFKKAFSDLDVEKISSDIKFDLKKNANDNKNLAIRKYLTGQNLNSNEDTVRAIKRVFLDEDNQFSEEDKKLITNLFQTDNLYFNQSFEKSVSERNPREILEQDGLVLTAFGILNKLAGSKSNEHRELLGKLIDSPLINQLYTSTSGKKLYLRPTGGGDMRKLFGLENSFGSGELVANKLISAELSQFLIENQKTLLHDEAKAELRFVSKNTTIAESKRFLQESMAGFWASSLIMPKFDENKDYALKFIDRNVSKDFINLSESAKMALITLKENGVISDISNDLDIAKKILEVKPDISLTELVGMAHLSKYNDAVEAAKLIDERIRRIRTSDQDPISRDYSFIEKIKNFPKKDKGIDKKINELEKLVQNDEYLQQDAHLLEHDIVVALRKIDQTFSDELKTEFIGNQVNGSMFLGRSGLFMSLDNLSKHEKINDAGRDFFVNIKSEMAAVLDNYDKKKDSESLARVDSFFQTKFLSALEEIGMDTPGAAEYAIAAREAAVHDKTTIYLDRYGGGNFAFADSAIIHENELFGADDKFLEKIFGTVAKDQVLRIKSNRAENKLEISGDFDKVCQKYLGKDLINGIENPDLADGSDISNMHLKMGSKGYKNDEIIKNIKSLYLARFLEDRGLSQQTALAFTNALRDKKQLPKDLLIFVSVKYGTGGGLAADPGASINLTNPIFNQIVGNSSVATNSTYTKEGAPFSIDKKIVENLVIGADITPKYSTEELANFNEQVVRKKKDEIRNSQLFGLEEHFNYRELLENFENNNIAKSTVEEIETLIDAIANNTPASPYHLEAKKTLNDFFKRYNFNEVNPNYRFAKIDLKSLDKKLENYVNNPERTDLENVLIARIRSRARRNSITLTDADIEAELELAKNQLLSQDPIEKDKIQNELGVFSNDGKELTRVMSFYNLQLVMPDFATAILAQKCFESFFDGSLGNIPVENHPDISLDLPGGCYRGIRLRFIFDTREAKTDGKRAGLRYKLESC